MNPLLPRRQPMLPSRPFSFGPRQAPRRNQQNTNSNVLAMFRDNDGNLDLTKVHTTVKQINDIYSQVSPLVSRFIKR
jgi:hypothetical protein